MVEFIHKSILWIHIPCGLLSLILFWIPVGVKKGSTIHRKVGKFYYLNMWVVVITSVILSICNMLMRNYEAAAFLGFLSIITAYPLWYSYEILNQKKEWSQRYFAIRRIFSSVLFLGSLGMFILGGVIFRFEGMGMTMVFFGLLGFPAIKDVMMNKAKAMAKEGRLKMHIQGTIISGIAAYTAFFAFGGRRIFTDLLEGPWMILPWILPTILGVIYSRYMQKRFRVA